MRALVILTVSSLSSLVAMPLPAGAQSADAGRLVEAERRFAAAVAEKGVRDGFLEYLAQDAILLDPAPIDGRRSYEARTPDSALLAWVPAFAETTWAGDMGWTTGPWIYRPTPNEDPVVGGHYVTIWEREKDDVYRVALDVGTVHEIPDLSLGSAETEAKTLPAPDPSMDEPEGGWEASLLSSERDLVADSARDHGTALSSRAAEDVRVYRNGSLPAVGLPAAVGVATRFRPLKWNPVGVAVSESGGLGYVYGTVETGPEGTEAGYLRIWNRGADGSWKVVLDLTTASPAGAD